MRKYFKVLIVVMVIITQLVQPGFAQLNLTSEAVGNYQNFISAGNNHSLIIRDDGTVWAWGFNIYGQVGDGTVVQRNTAVQVSGLTNVQQVEGGGSHSLALDTDGAVWAWGYNGYGALGDGSGSHRYTPVKVSSLTDIVQLSAGECHSVALKSDGTLWTFGRNEWGTLGDGTRTRRYAPVKVNNLTGITQVSAGDHHTLALKSDGTVWSWGYNDSGQLGDGTRNLRTSPVKVQGLSDIKQISAGAGNSFALKSDGSIWAWGAGGNGQLGDGTSTYRDTPIKINSLVDIVYIIAGDTCAFAIKSDGTVWSWGYNGSGRLGDGTTTGRMNPVMITGLADVIGIAPGYQHAMALKSDGTLWTWGGNIYGQIGDGTTTQRNAPVRVDVDFSPFKPAFEMTSEANINLNDINAQKNFTVEGTMKAVDGVKNYLKLVIKNNGELVSTRTLGLNNPSGTDAKGDYIQATMSGANITSQPINLSSQAIGKYNFTYYIESEDGTKSDEVTQEVTINRAINTPTSYVQLEHYETVLGLNDIQFSIKGKDVVLGLADAPYKFTLYDEEGIEVPRIGDEWKAASDIHLYNQTNLKPNTKYNVKLEIKNKINEIAVFNKEAITVSDTSIISVAEGENSVTSRTVTVKIADENPMNTEYRFFVAEKYVDSLGFITDSTTGVGYNLTQISESTDKTYTIRGLEPGKAYSVKFESFNKSGSISERSEAFIVNTLNIKPDRPIIQSYEEYDDKLSVSWGKATYADSYTIAVNGVEIGSTEELNYVFPSLAEKTNHAVVISAVNNGGQTESLPFLIITKPKAPETPSLTINQADIKNNSIKVQWSEVSNSIGYELVADGVTVYKGKKTDYTIEGLGTESQHVFKVRAYNAYKVSPWSPVTLVKTVNGKATSLKNLVVETTDTEMSMKWDKTADVYSCDVKINDATFKGIKDSFFRKGNLTPNTEYVYAITLKNEYNEAFILEGTVKTRILSTPENLVVSEGAESVVLSWDSVDGATHYQIEKDEAVLPEEKTENSFIEANPVDGTQYNYRVRAKSGENYSAWSDIITAEKTPNRPDVMEKSNVDIISLKDKVMLAWGTIATAIGYDIEINETNQMDEPINPVVIDTLNQTGYIHEELESLKTFKYRIRAKNNDAVGIWSDYISIATLPDVPKTPENIKILTNGDIATISWDAIEGPTKYRVLIKSSAGTEKTVHLGTKNEYHHRRLGEGIEYSYKLQSYNLVGQSQWSGEIVNNHLLARCKKGKEIDLGLTASEVTDFDQYTLKVFYNPGVLEIKDLCGYTSEIELEVGKIKGTDIEIIKFQEGEIVFKVNKEILNGYTWTGIVNNVKFSPKFSGGTPIGYVVEMID